MAFPPARAGICAFGVISPVLSLHLAPIPTWKRGEPPGSTPQQLRPGDNVRLRVVLDKPVALEEGSRFAIREGGRTVGAGVVTKIIK